MEAAKAPKAPPKAKASAKNKAKPVHPRSPQKPEQPSPNPGGAKRIRGKQSEAVQEVTELDDLREARGHNTSCNETHVCSAFFVIPIAHLIA